MKSYLADRIQSDQINGISSEAVKLLCGVHKEVCCNLTFHAAYIDHIIRSHTMQYNMHITYFYISLNLKTYLLLLIN